MEIPAALRYTEDHEWAELDGEVVRVGITDFAQEALGDVVFVELPKVGLHVDAGSTFGEIESTKSVSELYAPVAGTITEVNTELQSAPEMVNADPYGRGWICLIGPDDSASLGELLDASAYASLTATQP